LLKSDRRHYFVSAHGQVRVAHAGCCMRGMSQTTGSKDDK